MIEKQTTITYKRVKNLGNYESETLEVSTTVPEDMDVDTAITQLKSNVLSHLKIREQIEESNKIAF